jgi:hypothetical protein
MDKLKAAGRWLAKYVLPWLALLLGATTDAIGENLFGLPAWSASIILAGSGVLGQLGVLPWQVSPKLATVFGYLSSMTSAVMLAHAAGKMGPAADHAHLFGLVGVVGILFGVIGGRQGARATFAARPPDTSSTVTPLDRPPPSPKT